jgi:hypothetical protein
LTAAETKKIEADATAWVENGVKATTDKRLVYLRSARSYTTSAVPLPRI